MNARESFSPPLTPEQPHDADDALRAGLEAGGWRFTRQRAAVYRCLCRCQSHPTAEEVYASVKRDVPSISLATVYKSLETLVACNLAHKLSHAESTARYDARRDEHYHLRCTQTGQVNDLPVRFDPHLLEKLDPELQARLADQGFHMTGYRLEVLGYYGRPAD